MTNKKAIFKTLTEDNTCTLELQDDYVDCIENNNIVIDILDNDGIFTSPVVVIGTSPTKGTVIVNIDNTVTYEAITAEVGETDFFTYTVTDGDCVDSATVFITIDSELVPLPTYNGISLHKNTATSNACNLSGGNLVVRYLDTISFSTATLMFNDNHGLYLSPTGYYTDGLIYRKWNGMTFSESGTC